jgi:alpha-1,6-mannosyltransferase
VVGIRGSYMDRIIFSNQQHWATKNTADSLATAIETKCQQDLKEIGRQASLAARERYSWKTVFGRLFGIYEDVITLYSR